MNRGLSYFLTVLIILLLPIFLIFVQKRSLPPIETRQLETEEVFSLKMNEIVQQQTLRALSSHFPDEYKPVIKIEEPKDEIEVPVSIGPLLTNTVKYISIVTKSEVKHFYFKIVRSGEILDLTKTEGRKGWFLASIESDFFILTFEDITYKVKR